MADAYAVLTDDERYRMPSVPPASSGIGWLRATVPRFCDGPTHRRRRKSARPKSTRLLVALLVILGGGLALYVACAREWQSESNELDQETIRLRLEKEREFHKKRDDLLYQYEFERLRLMPEPSTEEREKRDVDRRPVVPRPD